MAELRSCGSRAGVARLAFRRHRPRRAGCLCTLELIGSLLGVQERGWPAGAVARAVAADEALQESGPGLAAARARVAIVACAVGERQGLERSGPPAEHRGQRDPECRGVRHGQNHARDSGREGRTTRADLVLERDRGPDDGRPGTRVRSLLAPRRLTDGRTRRPRSGAGAIVCARPRWRRDGGPSRHARHVHATAEAAS